MKAIILNNHCDARVFRIPGSQKFIKLPAFGSLPVRFSSEEELQAAKEELRKKAPAAQIIVIQAPLPDDSAAVHEIPSEAVAEEMAAQPVEEVSLPLPDTEAEASAAPELAEVSEPEPPNPDPIPVPPPKAKKAKKTPDKKNTPDKRKRRSSK